MGYCLQSMGITKAESSIVIKLKLINQISRKLMGVGVNSVFADHAGMIWIGMSDAGLDQFNPATGAFRHFLHTENDPDSVGG